ncbi:unnamed protein product [Cladocopium goreaui]|uniref:Uncharacterized protein n=1 Tax=Cladocopium goreaui TaxID=2562237 RepID=A0A9P1FPK3_9DINO|nr:unnamed protein product [Cladocopium goreaui]
MRHQVRKSCKSKAWLGGKGLDLKGAKALRNQSAQAERHALELALLRKELEICRSEAAAQIQALREELRSMGLVKLEEPEEAIEMAAEVRGNEHQPWHFKPSVGTWIQRPIQLQIQEPALAREMAAEEERWHDDGWIPYSTMLRETVVTEEEKQWRALQSFEVRQFPEYPRNNLTGERVEAQQTVQITHKIKQYESDFLKLASGGYVFTKSRSGIRLFERVEESAESTARYHNWHNQSGTWKGRQWQWQDKKEEKWSEHRSRATGSNRDWWQWQDTKEEKWSEHRSRATGSNRDWWSSWNSWAEQRESSPKNTNSAYPDPNDPKYRIDWDAFLEESQ